MNRPSDRAQSQLALKRWLRALEAMQQLSAAAYPTLLTAVRAQAEIHGQRIALLGQGEQLTYRDLVARAAGYSRWASEHGLPIGDVVGFLMPNSPDYAAAWLGLTHAGRIVALINTNLTGDALAHSIRAAGSRCIIVAAAWQPRLEAIRDKLPAEMSIWIQAGAGAEQLVQICGRNHPRKPSDEITGMLGIPQRALLIYTSGTTGLPKAANVSHARILEWSFWFAGMMDSRPEDRLYDCLPMYHSTGGVVGIGAMLVRGGSVLVADRFSSSGFWHDVVHGGCTVFQYIGELCRYLVGSPVDPLETQHGLRLCCGNGLRGDVWLRLQERFHIPQILEFYAATEGNISLYNCEEKPGAIGRIPPFLAHRFPVELVRVDTETNEPIRDANGCCIRCSADEPGEAISPIISTSLSPARQFDGYTDSEAGSRKVLRSAFTADDRWFRSGDLMRRDKGGYFYFVDRIGDTFRWKGENVSTDEVATTVASCPGVCTAVVYGVLLPNTEGRAGMAAVTTDEEFSLAALREHLRERLPKYARPIFVRECIDIPLTGTFKLSKTSLALAGLSAEGSGDRIWFDDPRHQAFVPCDATLIQMIRDGIVRL